MAEYIDRMKVRIAIIDTKWICDQDEDVAYDMIDSIPAADVEAVKHGRWEKVIGSNGKEYMVCTHCRHQQDLHGTFSYCPNCGAKMDGDKNG